MRDEFSPPFGKRIGSEDKDVGARVEHASTAKDWLNAFALCVMSVVRERGQVFGPRLPAGWRSRVTAVNSMTACRPHSAWHTNAPKNARSWRCAPEETGTSREGPK